MRFLPFLLVALIVFPVAFATTTTTPITVKILNGTVQVITESSQTSYNATVNADYGFNLTLTRQDVNVSCDSALQNLTATTIVIAAAYKDAVAYYQQYLSCYTNLSRNIREKEDCLAKKDYKPDYDVCNSALQTAKLYYKEKTSENEACLEAKETTIKELEQVKGTRMYLILAAIIVMVIIFSWKRKQEVAETPLEKEFQSKR